MTKILNAITRARKGANLKGANLKRVEYTITGPNYCIMGPNLGGANLKRANYTIMGPNLGGAKEQTGDMIGALVSETEE